MITDNFLEIIENLEVDDVVLLKGQHLTFQGNVTKINSQDETFEVYVTHASDVDAIGIVLPVSKDVMGKLFETLEIKRYQRPRENYLALIDLSLSLKDEDLFKYACKQLEEYDMRKKFLEARKIS
jgi:hypothetical protein